MTHDPSVTRWTPDMDSTLRVLYLSGFSDEAIADRLGIGPRKVCSRRGRLRLLRSHPAGSPWDKATEAELARLLGQGYSCAAIARQLGVTKGAVVGKIDRLRQSTEYQGSRSRKALAAKRAAVQPQSTIDITRLAPTSTCRWIPREVEPPFYRHGRDPHCGAKVRAPGEPYCPMHWGMGRETPGP